VTQESAALMIRTALPGDPLTNKASVRRPYPQTAEMRRLYQADWVVFETWCDAAGRTALPADAATLAAFLTEAATTLSASALTRRTSAVATKHRQRGFVPPIADPVVKALLRGARRAAVPHRAPRPGAAQLVRMAAACPGDQTGLRDRAVLLLLAASNLNPNAVAGIDVEHIRFTTAALELTLGAAAHPAHEGGKSVGRLTVPRGANLNHCPVQALRDWLDTSDTQFGPVFRKIDRWGTIEHRRLCSHAVRKIVLRHIPRRLRAA
jgi:hypothetical protein